MLPSPPPPVPPAALLIADPAPPWDAQQHPLSASLRQLSFGLRCAQFYRRDAVRFAFGVPLMDGPRRAKRFGSPSDGPRGARCHMIAGDEALGGWSCEGAGQGTDGAAHERRRRKDQQPRPFPRGGGDPCATVIGPVDDWQAVAQLSKAYGLWGRMPHSRDALRTRMHASSQAPAQATAPVVASGAPARVEGTTWPDTFKLAVLVANGAPPYTWGAPWGGVSPLAAALPHRHEQQHEQQHEQHNAARSRARSAPPLAFYLSALQALRVPGHNLSEPILVLVPFERQYASLSSRAGGPCARARA